VLLVGGVQTSSSNISKPTSTRLQIKTPINLNAGNVHQVYIPSTFGIINSTTSGVPLTIKVSTSKETTPVDSNPFTLVGTSVTYPTLTVTPTTAGANATYLIQFWVSGSGALSPASDYIKIEFPSEASIPISTSASYIQLMEFSVQTRV